MEIEKYIFWTQRLKLLIENYVIFSNIFSSLRGIISSQMDMKFYQSRFRSTEEYRYYYRQLITGYL